jgi:hypothetical protein
MKEILSILAMGLVLVSFASARETFYSALEDEKSVEEEGGVIDGGTFAPGKFGNGFVSEEIGDVIHFPVENRFTNLKEGTVELWVKMGLDAAEIADELFMFMTYRRGTDAVFLQFDAGGIARMRIKSAGSWHNADSSPLDWKEGDIHHMAGIWGPDGIKLYLDGELAGSDSFTDGPTVFAETLEINNASPPSPDFPTNCVVDEIRLSDHQKKPEEFIMEQGAVRHPGKASTVWGLIRTQPVLSFQQSAGMDS